MSHIDGYARVITDQAGNLLSIADYHWNHNKLFDCLSEDDIQWAASKLVHKDSELLLTLEYHYQEGEWIGADWSDPEQYVVCTNVFIMNENYKETLRKQILADWKSDQAWRYAEDMAKEFEEIYG